ncbi:MAG: EamA family transporter RarD [Rhodanobacteraceae bacterium]|nr:EamA family transporter RarD [Rhodanobacteraceae bacterium]
MSHSPPIDRRGLAAAVSAYLIWGVFPLYWALLGHLPALEIIAHRVLWCAVSVSLWLFWSEGRSWLRRALAGRRVGRLLIASSLLISVNWGVYIWAVTNGRVVDASLGYFINPLLSVALGVGVLGERLNRVQWSAVTLAAVGVLWLTLSQGALPWIALVLASSFAVYGLIRKQVAVEAVPGVAIESLILTPVALGWLLWLAASQRGAFLAGSAGQDVLLVVGGVLTALPLIGFAYGARRIPYSLVGILQYISPTLQLLSGVLLLGEPFGSDRAIGFGCIWLALAVYAQDGWRRRAKAP